MDFSKSPQLKMCLICIIRLSAVVYFYYFFSDYSAVVYFYYFFSDYSAASLIHINNARTNAATVFVASATLRTFAADMMLSLYGAGASAVVGAAVVGAAVVGAVVVG